MTAAIIPFPARYVVPTAEEAARTGRRPANDAGDLAANFADSTRRGDVIGALKRAAQAPRRGNRPAKVRDGAPRSIEAVRVEQATAWLEALIEVGDHGATADLLGAMHALVLAMDGRLRDRSQERLDSIQNGEPVADVANLRRALASMRAPTAPPPSGPRTLLAADPRYVALRREAMDALGALTGDLAPGVRRLGGVYQPSLELADLHNMTRELDVEVLHPSRGNVARMARQAAALALIVAAKVPPLRGKAVVAAERLNALASLVEQGGVA